MITPNCTIDTNCIIALEDERDYSAAVRDLIAMHNAGQILLRVVGVSASERQKNGNSAPNFLLFQDRLKRVGLETATVLSPPGSADFTYWDNSHFASQNGEMLEAEIHNVLWPNTFFKFHDYSQTADKTNPNWEKKWRNQKCDTLAFMAHVMAGSGLFVSNDSIFHGEKKSELLKFAGGDIARPLDARARLLDPTPFTPIPPVVAEFLRIPTERVDTNAIPSEFIRLHANKKAYDERLKQQQIEA